MSKAAILMLAVEVLAACILVHRIVKVARDVIAEHRAKRSASSKLAR
jgi:hypothetical protein